MKSPFKFLNAYTAADKHMFFGRDEEIEALFNMVFKTPMALVYGMSGTGKTSLIQCGLATRFDGPDWLPFYIRKENDINEALRNTLSSSLDNTKVTDLSQAIEDLFYSYFRPVYLIFDQFEELFILGSETEQKRFMKDIQQLINRELPCKILFVMREEYIGQLYEFEKILPGIFDYKLRIEPMSNKRVRKVMLRSFEQFNISLEEPEEELCQSMIDNISAGKSGIPLPYLQVYLDMLYRANFNLTYPDGAPFLSKIEFTEEKIEQFGQIDDILERFLKESLEEIQQTLETKFPKARKSTVATVLDTFVTEEGTKRPIYYSRDGQVYVLEKSIAEHLQISSEIFSFCLEKLDQARLLHIGEDTIELGHDTLAELIDLERTTEQRQLNDIKKRLINDYRNYLDTKEFLSEKLINVYEEYLPKLDLGPEHLTFVSRSRDYNKQLAQSEKDRQARELKLSRDKLAYEENARKRQKRLTILLGILLLFALGGIGLAVSMSIKAEVASSNAQGYNLMWKANIEEDKNPSLALRLVENAVAKNDDVTLKQEEYKIYNQNSFYRIIDSTNDQNYIYNQSRLTVKGGRILSKVDSEEYHLLNSSGKLIETLKAQSVTFSPTGDTLLICDSEGRVIMKDLINSSSHSFIKTNLFIETAEFLPNGKNIVAKGFYKYQLLNLSGEVVSTFEGVFEPSYSPSGDTIIFGTINGSIRLYNLRGEQIKELKNSKPAQATLLVGFFRNGRRIRSNSIDETNYIWDLNGTSTEDSIIGKRLIKKFEFSLDRQHVLVFSEDSTAFLLQEKEDLDKVFIDNSKKLLSLKFSPDGEKILTGSLDGIARLYDLKGNLLQTFKGHTAAVHSVAFLEDGKTIITSSYDRTVRLWDLKGLSTREIFSGHTDKVQAVAFASSGNLFVSGSNDATIRLWNVKDKSSKVFRGHKAPVASVAFSPDERFLLSGSDDSKAILWNVEGEVHTVFEGHTKSIHTALFSPHGDSILTASYDGTARLWNLQGDSLRKFKIYNIDSEKSQVKRIHTLAFSPDGKKILTGDPIGKISFWSINGDLLNSFKAHKQEIKAFAFSPDGKKIFSVGLDGEAILWDLGGKEIMTLGHSGAINSIDFSPDGKNLLTGSDNNSFNIWDFNGLSLQEYKSHSDVINSVSFSPDGKKILTGSNDKTIHLWEVNRSLKDFLREGNLQPLTKKQREEYGIN